MASAFVFVLCFGIVAGNHPAAAESPGEKDRAKIRIDSPFAAPIWRADIDASEQYAVVSGINNAVTVWNISDPRARKIVRVPLREEQRKRARAVAIKTYADKPEADLIAYSVPPKIDNNRNLEPATSTIYIIKRLKSKKKQIVKKLIGKEIPTRPQAIKFSRDGKYLAAVLSDGCGLRVWSTSQWDLKFSDDMGYGGADQTADKCCRASEPSQCDNLPDGNSVLFKEHPAGSVSIVTSSDTGVRSYQLNSNGQFERQAYVSPSDLALERPAGLALNGTGGVLAVGDRRNKAKDEGAIQFHVALINPQSLKPLPQSPLKIEETVLQSDVRLEVTDQPQLHSQADFNRVAWLETPQGKYIMAGGSFPCEAAKRELVTDARSQRRSAKEFCLARWTVGAEDGGVRFIPIGSERVFELIAMPKHRGILAVSTRLIGFIDKNGAPNPQPKFYEESKFADFRDLGPNFMGESELLFRISDNAEIIEFENYPGADPNPKPLTFDLKDMKVKFRDKPRLEVRKPDQDPEKEIIRNWRNTFGEPPKIYKNGNWVTPQGTDFGHDETYRSVALMGDYEWLLLGSSEKLRVVSYAGDTPKVICEQAIREDAFRVNVTFDGKKVVSAHSDGTLRWYRLEREQGGLACQLRPLLSAFIWQRWPATKDRPAAWAVTAWIPQGPSVARFTSDVEEGSLLQWQCTTSDGQVELTDWDDMVQFVDRDAIRKALADETAADDGQEMLDEFDRLTDCGAVSDRSKEAQGVKMMEFNEPFDRDFSTVTLPLKIWVNKASGWPKSYEIKPKFRIKTGNNRRVNFIHNGNKYGESGTQFDQAAVGTDGLVAIQIDVPESMRQKKGDVLVLKLRLDFWNEQKKEWEKSEESQSFTWVGPDSTSKPWRRFWSVMVGLSKYNYGPDLTLRFAENDALDMTRLFVNDYEERVVNKTSEIEPVFNQVHINLIVSPLSQGARTEIEKLATRSYVSRKFKPERGDIKTAIIDIAQRIENAQNERPDGKDFFMFFYSGHGMLDPCDNIETLISTVDTPIPLACKENYTGVIKFNKELIPAFKRIKAEKLVILDACRTLPGELKAVMFEPQKVELLAKKEVDIDFFFSGQPGNPSLELEKISFDEERKGTPRDGNSLFTYAILKGLTSLEAAAQGSVKGQRGIDIGRLIMYLKDIFYNTKNTNSPIHDVMPIIEKMIKEKKHCCVPDPRLMAKRGANVSSELRPDRLMRTLNVSD